MNTITAKAARDGFSDLLSKTAFSKERIIVTRNGKQLAALIPMEELNILEQVLNFLEYQHDLTDAQQALKEVETEGTISWNEVQDRLGL